MVGSQGSNRTMASSAARAEVAPLNWPASSMLVLTFAVALLVVPWYGSGHAYHAWAWLWFALFLGLNVMAMPCGYHRLFAHCTYEAHPVLKVAYLFFGAMELQNSALNWAAAHRVHHRFIDDPARDPFCARRGFWFSHIGWMLRSYPSGEPDFSTVRDLQRDPMVMWQHNHYLLAALSTNFGLPLLIGFVVGAVG